MKQRKVAIIGSGNLAYHFTPALLRIDKLFVSCLHSRNKEKGQSLCRNNKIAFGNSLFSIPTDVGIVFLMTSDDGVRKVSSILSELLSPEVVIVHFSGALGLDAIDPFFANVANVWPLQSISEKDVNLNLQSTPICVSASSDHLLSDTKELFLNISSNVIELDQASKSTLHLAAIFANNFTNHLLHLSQELLASKQLSFDLLKPLLRTTIEKAMVNDPKDVQTGPAIRNDEVTINRHLKLLGSKPELSCIYETLTNSIKKTK